MATQSVYFKSQLFFAQEGKFRHFDSLEYKSHEIMKIFFPAEKILIFDIYV